MKQPADKPASGSSEWPLVILVLVIGVLATSLIG